MNDKAPFRDDEQQLWQQRRGRAGQEAAEVAEGHNIAVAAPGSSRTLRNDGLVSGCMKGSESEVWLCRSCMLLDAGDIQQANT